MAAEPLRAPADKSSEMAARDGARADGSGARADGSGARADASADLLGPLKRYWGYESFRPKQENVIRSLLGGHDVCAVMPTGGGKSLCYQLPAVVSGKTVVVVSPLIALMQDQAAALAQMGIAAAALNSFLSADERRRVMGRAVAGEYRLIYLSPERLAAENTFDWLARVPVGFFAVDEAHCISEWGHEFRPDYRLLSRLRERFAAIPIAAFTASATRQVRHDILKQLQMREPHLYIASFHRENLNYVVRECEPQTQLGLLGRALRYYASPQPGSASGTLRNSAGETDCVCADDQAGGGDGGVSGGDWDRGDSVSREAGGGDAAGEPGTMDVRRGAGAGGDDRVWAGN